MESKSNDDKIKKKSHPIVFAEKSPNEWSWNPNSKSECVSLSTDLKTAFFYDNYYQR